MSDKDFRSQLEGLFSDLEPIRAEEGRLAFPEDVAVDITERQRAEEEIRRLTQFQESIIDNANVWLNVLDEKGNIVIWNKAAEEISGYSREDVAGHDRIWEWLYPDEEYRNEVFARAIARIEKGEEEKGVETTIRRKDGQIRIISWNSRSLVDEKGAPIGSITLGHDITERKRAEEELRQYQEHLEEMVEERTAELRRTNEQLEQEIAERKAAETEIRRLSQFLDAVIESANIWLDVLDEKGNVVLRNKAAEEISGYTREEVVGHNKIWEWLYPDEEYRNEIAARAFARMGKGGEDRDVETTIRRKDGQTRIISWNTRTLLDGEGNPIGSVALGHDITERKRTEEALRENEERFRFAVEATRDGLWENSLDHKRDFFSDRMFTMLGYEPMDPAKAFDFFNSLLHPDDIKNFEENYNAMDRPGHDDYSVGIRFKAKDGTWRHILSRGKCIERDDTGRPIRIVGTHTDITDLKRVEEALRESEERFRLTVEATRDGLWENSFDHKRDFFNDRMFTMLGYEPVDPAKAFDFFNSLLHPDDVKEHDENYYAMNRPGHDDYSVRVRFKAKDGTWHHILSRGKCVERDDTGRPARIIGTHTDITDLKRAEEALRKANEELERYTTDLERRTGQLQAAAEVSRATTSVIDPDELLRQVVDLVRERFDLYYAGLFLLDQERQFAVLRAATGEAGRKMLEAGHKLKVGGESMIGWCIANAQARIALDVGEEAVRFSNPLLPETRSEMALPLVSRGQVIGAMTIQSTQTAAFSEEDITVLQTMADQLASAIENARLFEDTKSRVAQLTALQETSKAVASTPELDKLLHLITQQATTLLQGDGGLINLADWETKEEEIFAASGSQAPYLGFRGPLEGSLSGWVILHNQPAISNQLQNDNRVDPRWHTEKERNQNAAMAPLTIKDQVMGTLVVMDKQGGKEGFDQADLDLLIAFANQAATAIENARLFEETRQTSFLLGRRVKELACLNDIGRQIEETPPVSEFLQWVTERIPPAMQYPDVCLAAIEFDGQVYGATEAVNLPCQMVQALRIGGEVAGRVYIAYTENHDFLDEESALLGDMVRRVSGYIESRRLFEQTQAALAEMEATHRLYLREQWAEYVPTLASTSYERTQPGVTSLGDAVLPEDFETSSSSVETLNRAVEQVMARREMVVQSSTDDGVGQAPSTGSGQGSGQAILVAPISLRGEVIGALGLYDTGNKRRWTDEEIALIEAVADQMALAIENTRLFEQTQRRASREKLLADITTRVRSSMDPQTILQTAARELGAALGADRAFVQLGKVTPVRSVTPATEGQETR